MTNPLIDSLLPDLDDVLGVRDSIGAVLHTIFFLTRTWAGTQPGDGAAADVLIQLLPTPSLKTFANDLRLREGGMVKAGDVLIRGISKHDYPAENQVDCSTVSRAVEKFYVIDDKLYNVVTIEEKYVTWDVLVRKLSDQTRY